MNVTYTRSRMDNEFSLAQFTESGWVFHPGFSCRQTSSIPFVVKTAQKYLLSSRTISATEMSPWPTVIQSIPRLSTWSVAAEHFKISRQVYCIIICNPYLSSLALTTTTRVHDSSSTSTSRLSYLVYLHIEFVPDLEVGVYRSHYLYCGLYRLRLRVTDLTHDLSTGSTAQSSRFN